jgi:hypothetical protein
MISDLERRKVAWVVDYLSNPWIRRNSTTDAELRRMYWCLRRQGLTLPAEPSLIVFSDGRP